MSTVWRRSLVPALLLSMAAPALARGGRRGMPRFPDTMSAGDAAFTLPLETLEGTSTVDLSESDGRPIVLIFGSYT